MSRSIVSSTSAGVSGVWFVCARFLPASGRVVQRPHRHVRHADVIDALRALPPDEVGEIRHRSRAQRLVPGVARLAPGDRVLHVDEPEEDQVIAKPRTRGRIGRQS